MKNKLYDTDPTWPYNRVEGFTQDDIEKCLKLSGILPHGSGINYTWDIERKSNGKFYASNNYDAMNENGYYCHVYPFIAIYKYNGENASEQCNYCNGEGERYISEMKVYHPEMTEEALYNWIVNSPSPWGDVKLYDDNGELLTDRFLCKVCRGSGKLPLHEFELERINFHGNKENSCCGYGLKDVLYQTCEYLGEEN